MTIRPSGGSGTLQRRKRIKVKSSVNPCFQTDQDPWSCKHHRSKSNNFMSWPICLASHSASCVFELVVTTWALKCSYKIQHSISVLIILLYKIRKWCKGNLNGHHLVILPVDVSTSPCEARPSRISWCQNFWSLLEFWADVSLWQRTTLLQLQRYVVNPYCTRNKLGRTERKACVNTYHKSACFKDTKRLSHWEINMKSLRAECYTSCRSIMFQKPLRLHFSVLLWVSMVWVVWLSSILWVLLLHFRLSPGCVLGPVLIGLLCLRLVRRLWFGLGVFPWLSCSVACVTCFLVGVVCVSLCCSVCFSCFVWVASDRFLAAFPPLSCLPPRLVSWFQSVSCSP